ncbi:MAG: hypothetical protein Q4B64_08995 [Spirochaetales bacterium]|nr:hypothetical protein [Spirochaetales bacterium]
MVLLFGIALIIGGYIIEAAAKSMKKSEELKEKRHLDLIQQMEQQEKRQLDLIQQMDLQKRIHQASLETEREMRHMKKRTVSHRSITKSPNGFIKAEEIKYEEEEKLENY